jgi:hypothetical protein
MTDDNKKSDLLRRIRALAAKTVDNGCTEAEAMSAAALLAKLVDRYGFTAADLSEPMEKVTQASVAQGRDGKTRGWFALDVAKFCDCKLWRRDGAEGKEFVFLGMETDVLMAQYLLALLETAARNGFLEFQKQEKLNAVYGFKKNRKAVMIERDNFGLGMSRRVDARLTEMKLARTAHVDPESGKSGGALVVVKNKMVTEAFAALNMRLKKARRGSFTGNAAAYGAGEAHGNRVAISPGVGGRSQLAIA